LTGIYRPKKSTRATLEFTDPGGDLRHAGAELEELLTLADVQQSDALVLVLGLFDGHDGASGVEAFELATALTDLAVVERRIERLQADRKRGLKEAEAEQPLLARLREHLLGERPLRAMGLAADELARLRGYQFLSLKPVLVVANVTEDALDERDERLATACAKAHHELCILSAPIEAELAEMSEPDRADFMADLGVQTPARDRFLRAAYASLGLLSFLTVGPDECRAWTVPAGATAPEAAGRIHSDLQRGFIRAEVVAYDDLKAHGDMKTAKAAGAVRLEGKEYVVQDGDVMEIRFSV
jgi:GTP-binding protein YchF